MYNGLDLNIWPPSGLGHDDFDSSLPGSQESTGEPTPSRSYQATATALRPATQGQVNNHIAFLSNQALLPVHEPAHQDADVNPSGSGSGVVDHSDLWSAAYREAIARLGEDIDVGILQGKKVAQLFEQLEEADKEATQESIFLRGVEYLRSIQVPLEKFKLALDLASPLTSIEPTASTVFGVVRSVSAIAISMASADLDFAKQIGDMLEQISYIDDCDTLGQKSHKQDIHEALVSVYQSLLEFYRVAFEILTRRGASLMVKMVLETDHLPNLVQEFLSQADVLRKLIQKATWEIVEDIKSMLYDREIARWLGSQGMSRQTQHHASLRSGRADGACDFLLENTDFQTWYQASNSRKLIILGDVGHGKSVCMSFLVDTLRQRNEHQLPNPKVCYYYCRDDESGRLTSILSTLILSLLEQLSGLKKPFFERYKKTQASDGGNPAADALQLEEFLKWIVETVDRPLFIVIDGLDECDYESRMQLMRILGDLSHRSSMLKILLSSRPATECLAQFAHLPSIQLGLDVRRDAIIVEHMVTRRLSYLSTEVKALVIETLSSLAQGSAIWVKMVVDLIQLRRITALESMRRLLVANSLPTELAALYGDIFLRCTTDDPENKKLAGIALTLLAASRRTLRLEELAWAATFGLWRHELRTVAAVAPLVDSERILSLIHPFISHTDVKGVKKGQVRLVHQSVKEFILGGGEYFADKHIKAPEAFALDLCIEYLLLEEIGHVHLFSQEQLAIEALPQDAALFEVESDDAASFQGDLHCTWDAWEKDMITYDPVDRGLGGFFAYAACHWVDHLGSITTGPFPALADVEKLCEAGSIRLSNWIEQNSRPGCTMKQRFEFDSTLYDPLSIFSVYGSETILRQMLGSPDLTSEMFLPQSRAKAVDQVLQWGDLSRLSIIAWEGKGSDCLSALDLFHRIMSRWLLPRTNHPNWDRAFDLVDFVLDDLVEEESGNELLCMAARMGCMPIVRRLMDGAQGNEKLRNELLRPAQRTQSSWGSPSHQSVGEAVLANHLPVVEYLLNQEGIETHLDHLNSRGENVLHLAATHCNPAVYAFLLPRLQGRLHQKDNGGDTALVMIVKSPCLPEKRLETAALFLAQCGDEEETIQDMRQAFRIAGEMGDTRMCKFLGETKL
ncbi:Vegetative incompatibility protein HET-E-like protein [Emericellopsis cladophorae]|uniref:Vegetative incompatibility protein HET-E-like protein n=1 Tax=Emericellopsis cladophorae TaxID=2686198 RepID=A0A9P9XW72_9HYPO|nr:Vegetative incompatibility protein HET-E-like protein [Emericellopsis cladophorae]KAI6778961.1 Vegetative incompatibility protein HET-E-like protein [Emericellopsis cladophorae]